MQQLKKMGLLLFLFISVNTYAIPQLIFAADLIRHGDRTPIHPLPNAPYIWPQGWGELTPEGMQQEFQLGSALRKKYIKQFHLLPACYDTTTMYVRSTTKDRALNSAQAFLLGLYPLGTGPYLSHTKIPALPAAYQPVPIHSVPENHDDLLVVKPSQDPSLRAHYYATTGKDLHAKSQALKLKLQQWSALSGLTINNLDDLGVLADNLRVRLIHHIALPKGFTVDTANEIIQLSDEATLAYFSSQYVSYPMGHAFLKHLANQMQQVEADKTPLKFILFSAHDSSIMAVMTTLGHPLHEMPPYAADLNFLLFKDNNQYYVKIIYNNKPVNLAACHDSDTCTLPEFIALADAG